MDTPHHHRPHLHRFHTANSGLSHPSDAAIKRERKQKSHDHRHHHHHHVHHRDRGIPDSGAQLQPQASFTDPAASRLLARSNGETQSSSRQRHEKSGSVDSGHAAEDGEAPKRRRPYTGSDLAKRKAHRRIRSVELRSSLAHLNEVSNTTTRRLDDTYYSILEKLSTLHSTISSLQGLSKLNQQLLETFEDEAGVLQAEVQDEIDGFNSFDTQATRSHGLEDRMRAGKDKVAVLGQRLEQVRARAEEWERKETEWQAKTSRRLRMLWSGLSIGLLLFAALLIFQYLPSSRVHVDVPSEHQANASMSMSRLRDEWRTKLATPSPVHSARPSRSRQSTTSDDGRLRVFDEL